MKKIYYYLFTVLIIVGTYGCRSSKDVVYLQDSNHITAEEYLNQIAPMYDAQIMPKDILTITVSTTDPDASRPFNITVPVTNPNSTSISSQQVQLNTYLVDNTGKINFPVLGMMELKGLTNREAEEKIKGLLKPYIKEDPLVTVKFGNYKISVMGEVASPGSFTVSQEKVNIFEALAMAGDMTIYGKRDNVKVIREDADGNKKIFQMNLNDPYVIFSSDYYLQQNDVVIVEPNNVRTQSAQIGPATALWMSGISIAISITTLVINILK
ncbi:MAG TPA: polysaccharide biosynthesis/export family protein [Petrimonas sp.]|nr:polysaccharide biosynthesis/export family protein [Petrimonas sp.]